MVIEALEKKGTKTVEDYIQLARIYWERAGFEFSDPEAVGSGEYAIELYRKCLKMDPENTDLYLEFGNLLLGAGVWREAFRVYQEGLRHNPPNPARFHGALGLLYTEYFYPSYLDPKFLEKGIKVLDSKFLEKGVQEYKLAWQTAKKEDDKTYFYARACNVFYRLLEAYFERKDYTKVVELWDKYKLDSAIVSSGSYYAPSLYHLGRYKEALEEFQRVYGEINYPPFKKEVQNWIKNCKDKLSQ
jgi:tetratricopeptide (TPR) repeat protein